MFAHYLITKAGHNVAYLGQNVPTENLETTIQHINPDVLVLFVVRTWHKDELVPLMDSITKYFKNGKTILCGNGSLTDVVKQNKSLQKAHSIEDLEDKI